MRLATACLILIPSLSLLLGCETEPITPASPEKTPIVEAEPGELDTRLADARTELEAQIGLYDAIGTEGIALNLDVDGGVVTLSGTVEDADTAEQAVAAVRDVRTVTRIVDRIEVVGAAEGAEEATPAQIDVADLGLASRVRLELLDRLEGRALDLRVDAEDGVVTLSGTAPSAALAETAVAAARSVVGVDEVVNQIQTSESEESREEGR